MARKPNDEAMRRNISSSTRQDKGDAGNAKVDRTKRTDYQVSTKQPQESRDAVKEDR